MTIDSHLAARVGVSLVWIAFGLGAKVLRLVPRHERIVARILGPAVAPLLTRLIGLGECLVGGWFLSGFEPIACALFQTLIVVIMNAIELWKARDLLLAPVPMVLGNTALLSVAWYVALAHG
jgi:hypothetical protein